ncbi:putative pre-rrna-processing protein esf2 [Phaeomoniella chlamydospora]|uniref:Pre-rRNA-processing protein ESF2 n=1 Tax=Phaeomoniella chlamydospora TaxID=158046 RepID=A0A0G2EUW5_PHACM|nr:putative pre-rrna-processing protein esf2 [Phaeomoniella chlamydospora]
MAPKRERNEFLEAGSEDESDNNGASDDGYDSEAADAVLYKSRGSRATEIKGTSKKRKIESYNSDAESTTDDAFEDAVETLAAESKQAEAIGREEPASSDEADDLIMSTALESFESPAKPIKSTTKTKQSAKSTRPGVIYLPSLPPHLKPSALRNMLEKRGFGPIVRQFLTPSTTSSTGSKSRSRKSYVEGWIEFASHKTAKKCVEALNAVPIGGPKRSYYHDDLWNMRYLKGMTWTDLMGQIREERREGEVRKSEERRKVRGEVEQFLRGVQQSKQEKTRIEKREKREKRKGVQAEEDLEALTDQVQAGGRPGFEWKQFKVMDRSRKQGLTDQGLALPRIDEGTQRVLAKIF